MCQYKISCKATQKYWFFIEINSLRILDIQCAIWNNIKKIETINIDINSLVCKCDLFYIIFNGIANFLKQLAENVIYIKAVFNSFLLHWIKYQKFGRVMNCVKDYTLYIHISVCRSAHAEKRIETASSKGHTWTCTAGLFTRLNTGNI